MRLSASRISDLLVYPWLFIYNREHPKDDTAATLRGKLLHNLLLEPNNPKFTLLDKSNWEGAKTKASLKNKALYELAEQTAKSEGKTLVENKQDWDDCHRMRDIIIADNNWNLFSGGQREVYHEWDTKDGCPMKGYADLVIPDAGLILDIKTTTSNLTPDAMRRTIVDYHYNTQMCVYRDGMSNKYDCEFEEFWILWVNMDYMLYCFAQLPVTSEVAKAHYMEQHGVSMPGYLDCSLEAGEFRYQRGRKIFTECMRTGVWPASEFYSQTETGEIYL